jgi:hypothetical protein
MFHIELIVLTLTEGKTELLIIKVYLYWVLWTVSHTSRCTTVGKCPYADTRTKEDDFYRFYFSQVSWSEISTLIIS